MNQRLTSSIGKRLKYPPLLFAISFIVCFLLAIYLNLSLEPFARQLENLAEKKGLHLKVQNSQLQFPLGLGAERLDINHSIAPDRTFEIYDVDLRPLWLSLIGSNPGLRFDLVALQGHVSGTAHSNGEVLMELVKLKFDEPLGLKLPLSAEGVLEKGVFRGVLPLVKKNRVDLQLDLTELRVKGTQSLGSGSDQLQLGELSLTAESKGPRIRINNLSISGPEIDIKGNGSLLLGRSPTDTSMNINLVLTPKAGLDPGLKDMLGLIKKPMADGSFQINLRGTLTRPRIN